MNRYQPPKHQENGSNTFSEEHSLPEGLTKEHRALAAESRKSFFSGHALLPMYATTFIVIYIHENVSRSTLSFTVMTCLILKGIYPGLTQWKNYWHHWDDVVAGYILGIVTAYISYFHLFP
jgi:phosphatidate phosphatase